VGDLEVPSLGIKISTRSIGMIFKLVFFRLISSYCSVRPLLVVDNETVFLLSNEQSNDSFHLKTIECGKNPNEEIKKIRALKLLNPSSDVKNTYSIVLRASSNKTSIWFMVSITKL